MWQFWHRALLVLALFLGSTAAEARRVAIIIANESYASEARLYNPLRDANAIAAALGPQGAKFDQVLVLRNLDLKGMRRAIQTITATNDADALIVYYSGHGMRDGFRRNFLLPVDAQISKPEDIAADGIDAEELVTAVRTARPKLGLIVLDACRNNPFYEALGTKSVGRGLDRRGGDGLNGVLVAYAAEGGQTADDGRPGAGSPFATAFARRIATPGTPLLALLDDISDEVASVTNGRQVPTRDGNLRAYAMLIPAVLPPPRPTPAVVAAPDLEREAWDLCKAASVAGPCRAYLAGWDKGTYARLAKIKIDSLTPAAGGGSTFVPARPGSTFVPAGGGATFVPVGSTVRPDADPGAVPMSKPTSTLVTVTDSTARALAAIRPQDWWVGDSADISRIYIKAGGSVDGLRQYAQAGNADAMMLLADILSDGRYGVAKDMPTAMLWLRRAADQEQSFALLTLGQAQMNGQYGMSRDRSQGLRTVQLAAKKGNAMADVILGIKYQTGSSGVAVDERRALAYFQSAADKGLAYAQTQVATMQLIGQAGLSPDPVKAARMVQSPAERGDSTAQFMLGSLYEFGQGVPESRTIAIGWYRKAAAQKNADAIAALKRLGSTP
ncbi:MAG: hypothetical protein RL490_1283 [Pseudomonadota bacterium]|jgi:TPR repeat protein